MTLSHTLLPAAFAAAALAPLAVSAQVDGDRCILAGRITPEQQWAPRFAGVQLIGAGGQVLRGSGKEQLASVRQARLSQPALLSRCDGNKELLRIPDSDPAGVKSAAAAITAGVVDVESVAFPKLRAGSELVELKVRVAADRVVMLTR